MKGKYYVGQKVSKIPPQRGDMAKLWCPTKYESFILRHRFVSISLPEEGGGLGGHRAFKNPLKVVKSCQKRGEYTQFIVCLYVLDHHLQLFYN